MCGHPTCFFLLLSQRTTTVLPLHACTAHVHVVCARILSLLLYVCACSLPTCARANVLLLFLIIFFNFVASLCVLAVRACFSPRAFVRMCDMRACCLIKLCMPACACWLPAHVRARQCSFIVCVFLISFYCFFYFVVNVSVLVMCAHFNPRPCVRMCDVCACCLSKLCMSAWVLNTRVRARQYSFIF